MDASLNPPVSGLSASEKRLNVRAHNVANTNTEGFSGSRVVQTETQSGTRVASVDKTGEDLAGDLTDIKVSKHAHAANAKVVRVIDKMLGTILDLKK